MVAAVFSDRFGNDEGVLLDAEPLPLVVWTVFPLDGAEEDVVDLPFQEVGL